MGLDFHSILFLASEAKRRPLGRTATLGRLQYFAESDTRALRKYVELPFEQYKNGEHCESLLNEYFGAIVVDSFDASKYEGATYVHDFNYPIKHSSTYDVVIDFGTLEHIFNVAQALENAVSLCRTGGRILHCLPADNWNGHGFWQFSPELFFSFYSKTRGFSDTEIFLAELRDRRVVYRVRQAPTDGSRFEILSRSPTYVLVSTTRVGGGETGVQQSDYAHTWARSASCEDDGPKGENTASIAPPMAPPSGVRLSLVQQRPTWLHRRLGAHPMLERRLRHWKNNIDHIPYLLNNPAYFFRDESRFQEISIEDLLRRG